MLGHIGRHIDGFGEVQWWKAWCMSEEFGRKNVIRALSGEGIVCVKYMV